MVDFRKWFPLLAIVALLAGTATTASAQVVPAFACATNAGVPPTVRAEGLTELVGDMLLNCTNGTVTAAGTQVPQTNIQIFLNTNVTSRWYDPGSEALLMIDDPAAANQNVCPNLQGGCPITGIGGAGIDYKNATVGSSVYNVYQGRMVDPNSVVWLGVAIDPPGTNATRIIRITNVRANANQLGVSSSLIPSQIQMFISATGTTSVPINNPQQVVAFVQVGLTTSIRNPSTVDNDAFDQGNFLQCVSVNRDLSTDNTASVTAGSYPQGPSFRLRFAEGFASSFKRRVTGVGGTLDAPNPIEPQNIPGGVYNTESGFYNPSLTYPDGGTGDLAVGLATHGTRLMARFNNIPAGVVLYASTYAVGGTTDNGATPPVRTIRVRRVTTDANGDGTFSATAQTSATAGGIAPVAVSGGTGVAVWEVLESDPFRIETVQTEIVVAFTSNTASNLPGLGTGTVNLSFAPISTVTTRSSSAAIPRFADTSTARNLPAINPCSANILFPHVTQRSGFDTGLVISNTSLDSGNGWTASSPQAGACKINYYGDTEGGGAAPAAQTSGVIAAGKQLIWTLFAGGVTDTAIKPTPGFQGYIIAGCAFQYAHGFAFISDLGARNLAMGYLALILDDSIPSRTGFASEVLGH
jgi:hypothetical protein